MNLLNICEIKISYNPKISPNKLPKITSSQEAAEVFRANWKDLKHVESFYILLLNRSNRCIGIKQISSGGISGTVADPKLILQTALIANASSIILAHNHPSDNIKPSENDKKLTTKLTFAGDIIDCTVLDHIILGWEEHFSFANEGIL